MILHCYDAFNIPFIHCSVSLFSGYLFRWDFLYAYLFLCECNSGRWHNQQNKKTTKQNDKKENTHTNGFCVKCKTISSKKNERHTLQLMNELQLNDSFFRFIFSFFLFSFIFLFSKIYMSLNKRFSLTRLPFRLRKIRQTISKLYLNLRFTHQNFYSIYPMYPTLWLCFSFLS